MRKTSQDQDHIRTYYESISQCASMTGIPVSVLRQAKRAGCPAFRDHRVRLEPLLRWLFDPNREADGGNAMWGIAEYQNWRARREHLAFQRESKKLIECEDVMRACEDMLGELFGVIEQFFIEEAPAMLKGLTEEQIIAKGRPLVEGFKETLRKKVFAPTNEAEDKTTH